MENVYIGARYVPKFANPVEWSAIATYEPLTIVTHQGASYTSRTFVPSGTPLTDPNYWVITGNYNAQIDQYRQEVSHFDNRLTDNEAAISELNAVVKERKWLFIGDSYGDPINGTGWIEKAAAMMGIPNTMYYNLAKSGTGFADGSWQNILETWVATNPNEVENIGYILIGGGLNDSTETGYANLPAAMSNFASKAFEKFTNVKIMVAYFGWALDTSPYLAGRTGYWRGMVQNYYNRASTFGMRYLTGCELAIHDRTAMQGDELHPNNVGAHLIAECVSNAVRSGSATVTRYGAAEITPVNGTIGGTITQTIFGNNVTINFNNLLLTNCNITFNGWEWVKIADIILPFGNAAMGTPVRVHVTLDTGAYKVLDAYIIIQNNELNMRFVTDNVMDVHKVTAINGITVTIPVDGHMD